MADNGLGFAFACLQPISHMGVIVVVEELNEPDAFARKGRSRTRLANQLQGSFVYTNQYNCSRLTHGVVISLDLKPNRSLSMRFDGHVFGSGVGYPPWNAFVAHLHIKANLPGFSGSKQVGVTRRMGCRMERSMAVLEECTWVRKGDYYRYLAEFKFGNDKKEAADQSLKAYQLLRDNLTLWTSDIPEDGVQAAVRAGRKQQLLTWGGDPGYTMICLLDVASRLRRKLYKWW
ncbi:hypothetical protein L2E82_06418 [Cichorium intybus]|uniref:Uncharacterized protein n=1 Tax=Cichorium intybus TaxID=13427 RepID=A0ACB9HBA3_CICIN|nr:hypothetical protein L2E82_06418 [Cichorium intybus]